MFNAGRAMQWNFVDGLGVNTKADPEIIDLTTLILGQVARPSFCQGTPHKYYWQGTWRTLHSCRILYTPGVLSEHGGRGVTKEKKRNGIVKGWP